MPIAASSAVLSVSPLHSPNPPELQGCGSADDISMVPRTSTRALPPPSVIPMSPFPFHPKVPLGEHRRLPGSQGNLSPSSSSSSQTAPISASFSGPTNTAHCCVGMGQGGRELIAVSLPVVGVPCSGCHCPIGAGVGRSSGSPTLANP